jgi:molybdopterin converting factor small subunit
VATVVLPHRLARFTGGVEKLELEVASVRELIDSLDERFPGLGDLLREGTAVAIDGEIYPDALLERIEPESEVHFLPRVGGGA